MSDPGGPLDRRLDRRVFLRRMTALTAAASTGALAAEELSGSVAGRRGAHGQAGGSVASATEGRGVPTPSHGGSVGAGPRSRVDPFHHPVPLPDPVVIAFDDPWELTLAEAASLIQSGDLRPGELLEAYLARIATFDRALQAFNTVTGEEAREGLAALESGAYRGPLHGIPLALKDNFYTAGIPTTANSHIFADFVPDCDATAWSRLAGAGALLIGKTQMGPLATTAATTPDGDRTTVSAWAPGDRSVSPGGSSSGSATAVAAALAAGATGTQTGGSITNPAAAQGLTGLKPTMGRVSLRGIIPLTYTRDHPGPLARDARDAAILLQAMAGPDPEDPRTLGLPAVPDLVSAARPVVRGGRPALRWPTTVGVLPGYGEPPAKEEPGEGGDEEEEEEGAGQEKPDEERRRRAELRRERQAASARSRRAMLETFRELGAEVVEVEPPDDWETLTSWSFNNVRLPERTEPFLRHLREDVRQFGVSLSPWINGLLLPGTEYLRGQRAKLLLLRRVLDDLFARCDVVVQTSPIPFDMIGLPLIAFPVGMIDGRPTGAMLGGQPYAEDRLLSLVAAYQSVTDWHRRRPADPGAGGAGPDVGRGGGRRDPRPEPPPPGERMGVWEVMRTGE